MALEQDRQVFAVPGSPLSGKTRGSNRLLREGAVLVECVEDVIEDLAPQMAGKRDAQATASLSGAQATPEVDGDRPALEADTLSSASIRSIAMASGNPSEKMVEEKTKEIQTLLNCLTDAQSLHVDAVIESCQLPPQTVLNLLLELELRGLVVQHPGKLFSLP
jgi:DNA processing protein